MKVEIVALVLHLHQSAQQVVHAQALSGFDGDDHLGVVFRRTKTVNARDRGHDEHVPSGQQGVGCGVTQLVDLLVDGGILFYIGVAVRQVGFGLIIIVITDKVLHRVVREKLFELVEQLGGQSLVRGHDQGGSVQSGHHPGHGESLARTGHAQEHLLGSALLQA